MQPSEERTYLMALTRLYSNRLRAENQLLDRYGSAVEVWKHIDEAGKNDALRKVSEEEKFIEKHQIEVLCREDAAYPYRLRECPDAPILLYGKGNVDGNTGKMVSVVGTRNCSERGKDLTRQLVLDLAAQIPNLTIVSGLAYGIDVAAHKAALEAGVPTIIITGHGLDRIYPVYHRNVAIAALEKGGILTEYMSGTEPDRQNFVARDRIIAGMADAVVVVESKAKGGSLITASMACDYSRSLFAFPGRVQDELSRGCNQLIRDQKAALIESADDLIKAMMWETSGKKKPIQAELVELEMELTEEEQLLLQKLRAAEEGMHINFLMQETQLTYPTLVSTLAMMEMKQLVKSLPGGIYRALR